jgi:hypothetical protein
MSSEKRTIKINPELFKLPDKNTSRKKRENNEFKIKVKPEKQVKNKSLRRSVMKMIREKQQEEYKKLFSNDVKDNENKNSSEINHFNKDFENSLEYFNSLVEKEREKEKEIKNNTIKRYSENLIHTNPVDNSFHNYVHNELPDVFNHITPNHSTPPIHINQPPRNPLLLQSPKYGCLKNGTLPTYRNYYNTTRRLQEPNVSSNNNIQGGSHLNSPPTNISNVIPVSAPISTPFLNTSLNTNSFLNTTQNNHQNNEIKKDLSEKVQKFQKGGEHNQGNKKYLKYLKRRKIYKRTYKIGRSKTKPQISVLVSNKTIRNRITTEAQLLKQTPIHEVRQYLVKKGFIKVGSLTPNDVLRKMYESVSLICGDVQNHNPENLLYNFMNDSAENKS